MNFGYGYEREFKTFFTQKIKRIDLKERIYSPQKLKFQNETSIQESNIVANFCATVFVLQGTLPLEIYKGFCTSFFLGTCSFFNFFVGTETFFCFCRQGALAPRQKQTNKFQFRTKKLTNKSEFRKKAGTGILCKISKWQSPLVQIAVAQKPGIQKYWLVYPFHFGKKKTKMEQVPMKFF